MNTINIDTMIKELQRIQAVYGNIPVYNYESYWENEFSMDTSNLKVTEDFGGETILIIK